MKQLDNLDSRIPFPRDEDTTDEQFTSEQAKMGTFRKTLRYVLMNTRAGSLEEADRCDQIRLKLMQAESSIVIDDSEFSMLMQRVKENPLGWPAYTHVQIANYLREAEKKKVEVVLKSTSQGE
jgi:hypothetical protein